jgi:hypothetical protein
MVQQQFQGRLTLRIDDSFDYVFATSFRLDLPSR